MLITALNLSLLPHKNLYCCHLVKDLFTCGIYHDLFHTIYSNNFYSILNLYLMSNITSYMLFTGTSVNVTFVVQETP